MLEHKEQKTKRTRREKGAVTVFSPPLAKNTTKKGKKPMSHFKLQNWLIKAADDHTHQAREKKEKKKKRKFSIDTVLLTATSGSLRWKTGTAMLLSEVCRVKKPFSNLPPKH